MQGGYNLAAEDGLGKPGGFSQPLSSPLCRQSAKAEKVETWAHAKEYAGCLL